MLNGACCSYCLQDLLRQLMSLLRRSGALVLS